MQNGSFSLIIWKEIFNFQGIEHERKHLSMFLKHAQTFKISQKETFLLHLKSWFEKFFIDRHRYSEYIWFWNQRNRSQKFIFTFESAVYRMVNMQARNIVAMDLSSLLCLFGAANGEKTMKIWNRFVEKGEKRAHPKP